MPAKTAKLTVNLTKCIATENDLTAIFSPDGKEIKGYKARFESRHIAGDEYNIGITFEKDDEIDEGEDFAVVLGPHKFREVSMQVTGEFTFPPMEDVTASLIEAACLTQNSKIQIVPGDDAGEFEIIVTCDLFIEGQTKGEISEEFALKLIGTPAE